MGWRKGRHKYNVSPKEDRTVDGIVFDSKKEANRYGELKLLRDGGRITDLELQRSFDLIVNGMRICTYRADFSYVDESGPVVEDTKGFKTEEYRLKKKLMLAIHQIKIRET